jgi:hypothetical protein
MAGSFTVTNQSQYRGPGRPVQRYTIVWTSSAGGAVSGTATGDYISGQLVRVVFIPGTAGVQPSNNYSVQLTDSNGLDILAGQGASLSNSTTTNISPGMKDSDGTNVGIVPAAIDDQLTPVVSAAGNAKQGTVVLYIR